MAGTLERDGVEVAVHFHDGLRSNEHADICPEEACEGGGTTYLVFRNATVNFYVKDVEASARFYRDLFGFTETFRTPERGTPLHMELRLGEFTLGLAAIDAARSMHGLPAGTGPARAELVVWTDDVDDTFAAITAKGVGVISAPHDFLDAALRAAWVADPDGNPVQIVARRRPRR